MKVFTFEGDSLTDFEGYKFITWILEHHIGEKIIIVVSSPTKIENALKKIVEDYLAGKTEESLAFLETLRHQHLTLVKYLFAKEWQKATNDVEEIMNQAEDTLKSSSSGDHSYLYESILSTGGLLTSALLSVFLRENGLSSAMVPISVLNKPTTETEIQNSNKIPDSDFLFTQSIFQGKKFNKNSFVSNEKPDYTAALLAGLFSAESITSWKVSSDYFKTPSFLPNLTTPENLSYTDAKALALYGDTEMCLEAIVTAEEKAIPIYLKSVADPSMQALTISDQETEPVMPLSVCKKNMALVTLVSVSPSWNENSISDDLHILLSDAGLNPLLMETENRKILLCVKNDSKRIEEIARSVSDRFEMQVRKNLSLLTIRNYTEDLVANIRSRKEIILEKKPADTIHLLYPED